MKIKMVATVQVQEPQVDIRLEYSPCGFPYGFLVSSILPYKSWSLIVH